MAKGGIKKAIMNSKKPKRKLKGSKPRAGSSYAKTQKKMSMKNKKQFGIDQKKRGLQLRNPHFFVPNFNLKLMQY